MFKRRVTLAMGMWFALCALAQSPETFKTRLAPVAVDTAMKAAITGSGSVSAMLAGSKLTVDGTFEGMKSPATAAHIHQGSAPGVRGGPLLTLTVTKAMSGTVSGSFDLTPEQLESFKRGKWYVQIHASSAESVGEFGAQNRVFIRGEVQLRRLHAFLKRLHRIERPRCLENPRPKGGVL